MTDAQAGRGALEPSAPLDEFMSVRMLQAGGPCQTGTECLWLTAVQAPGTLVTEHMSQHMEAQLSVEDFERVLAITNSAAFRALIESDVKPMCPASFDSEFTLELRTASVTYIDSSASGCIVNDQVVPSHPYRDLATLLVMLRRTYLPDAFDF